MNTINASIITIGDELLIGQTIDTNSAYIAQELNKIGVWVHHRVAVGDVYDDIWQALDDESERSDIVIITGGLGPTADDITKPLLCKYFGGRMIVNEEVLAHVKYLFEKVYRRPGGMLERNQKQAEVPDVCTVLYNARGTAPGMMFTASPNPSAGGALEPVRLEKHQAYSTADPLTYGLLKEFVAKHRSYPTVAENVLWQIVRNKKMAGFKFRRQHIISNYIADFVCLSEQLIIEVDGLQHKLPENKKNDEERTSDLNKLGFEVIRFTNEQVLHDTDNVISNIILRLKERNQVLRTAKVPPSGGFRGAVFFSLPGVPHEMKGLITDEVIPRLKKIFDLPAIIHRTLLTAGIGESMLAELIKDFESSLPENIKLAYLPNYGMVKLRLTAKGDKEEEVEKMVEPYFRTLQELTKEYLVTNKDEGLEMVVGKLLKTKNKTLGTAESCTGGYIAHLITSVPGSSAYFKGTVVSYANEIKEKVLGVKKKTLLSFGAVSEETAIEMVSGILKILNTDYAIAVTGIMGPDGGSDEKPVGTVWVAIGSKTKVETHKLNLRFDRQRNISLTAVNALNLLRKFILNEP